MFLFLKKAPHASGAPRRFSKPNTSALLLLLALALCGATQAAAAAGDVDPTFNPGAGVARRGSVSPLAVQPDGKVVVGGVFQSVDGVQRGGVMRLNTDGSVDANFNLEGAGFYGSVSALVIQPDGKILVGGSFNAYNGTPRGGLARLNADGSLDASFLASGAGADGTVFVMALRSDGKLVIGGLFSNVNGVARGRVARLNADGTTDASFAGADVNGSVFALALQPDGKVVLGGSFDSISGTARGNVARLNADGSLDTSFLNTGSGANSDVFTLALQPDGRVLVGGGFTTFNDASHGGLVRLNADGSLDGSFDAPAVNGVSVEALALQPDGKVLVVVDNGTATLKVVRLNSNGSRDDGYQSPSTDAALRAIGLLPDGRAYIGGAFSTVNGTARGPVARLDASGNLDASFVHSSTLRSAGQVEALTLQADGKVIAGGTFSFVNGAQRFNLARFGADGSHDTSFVSNGFTTNNTVKDIAVQPDGKVVVVGLFTMFGGSNQRGIVRLNADGSVEPDFPKPILLTSAGANGAINAVALQPDGKIVVGGSFRVFNGAQRDGLARLNADGSLDTSFTTQALAGFGGLSVSDVALQPDGKIIIGGRFFVTIDGKPTSGFGVARLNADGSTDSSFYTVMAGLLPIVNRVAVQPDGKVLIGGRFEAINGTPRHGLARLNADGSPDASFAPGTTTGTDVEALALQPDGKVLVGGLFNTFGGVRRNNLVRLKADGSLDETFLNFGPGVSGAVRAIALQPDGRVLIGGDFSSAGGAPRFGVARLGVGLSPNPIDTAANFVTQHYRDFLNREPDAAGLDFWSNQMTNCGNPNLEVCRINVSAAFFLSIEFKETGYLVYLTHQAAFAEGPGLRRAEFLADMRAIASGVVVGADGWEQQLEANKRAYFDAFVARQAFLDKYPLSLTPAQFVDALDANTRDPNNPAAGGSLTQSERNALADALAAGAMTRAQVLRALAEHEVFRRREFNRAFVLMQYFGYLRRDPDREGFDFWLAKLNQFNGNFVEAEMVKAFINSIEYRERFGTP